MHVTDRNHSRQASRHTCGGSAAISAGGINPLTAVKSPLPSPAPLANLMPFLPTARYFLLIFSLFCMSAMAGATEKSLYNKETAQKVDVSKLSFLGPQASRF